MSRCVVALLALAGAVLPATAEDWPQLQCNPQRTGYTTDVVKPPYRIAWHREFPPERVARQVQAVVHAGKVFVGTKSGNLYALDAKTGKEAWKYASGSAILHTVACADGKVVLACIDGSVRAVSESDGSEVWRFQENQWYAFSAAPLLADGSVFIGQRQGVFFALDLRNGKRL